MAGKQQSIRSLSTFLDRTRVEVEKVLGKLKWTKEKLLKEAGNSKLVQCPFNQSHLMSPRHLKKHAKVCQYASEGLNRQDIRSSPAFFYQSSKMAIPIFIGERQYTYFKNWKEGTAIEVPKEDDVPNGKALRAHLSEQRLQEEQPMVSDSKIQNSHGESMDNERSIMAWDVIPASHQKLELSLLPQQTIKRWIIENLPQVQYLSSVDGASDHLVNFVLSCLQETSVAHPAGMEKMLADLLGNETQSFVLKLWKFLAVSLARAKLSTKEASVEAQGHLGNPTRLDSSEDATIAPTQMTGIPVPMERVVSELTPQQRLAMYEHVIRTSKAAREDDERKENLDDIADVNNTQGQEDDLPKSHFEMLAERRDYKRRRQSYRAKNVHITKRSAVEVMRDLIETQMHVLEMQIKGEHDGSRTNSEEEDNCPEDKPVRDNKQREDYSRGDGRGYEKWKPDRNRDRRREKESGKRTRDYDSRESEVKRSRRQ